MNNFELCTCEWSVNEAKTRKKINLVTSLLYEYVPSGCEKHDILKKRRLKNIEDVNPSP